MKCVDLVALILSLVLVAAGNPPGLAASSAAQSSGAKKKKKKAKRKKAGLGSSGSYAYTKTDSSSASDSNTKRACRCQINVNNKIYNLDKLTGQALSVAWSSSAFSSGASGQRIRGYFLTVCGSYLKCGATPAAMVQTATNDTPLSGNKGGPNQRNGDNGNLGTCRQTIGSWNSTITKTARAYRQGTATGFTINFANGGVCADSPAGVNPPKQTAAAVNFICDPKVHGVISVQHTEPTAQTPGPCRYVMNIRTKCACDPVNGKPACKAMCKKPCAGASGMDASSSSRASSAASGNPPKGCNKYKGGSSAGLGASVDASLQDSGAIGSLILVSAFGVCLLWYTMTWGLNWTPFQQLDASYVAMGQFKKNDGLTTDKGIQNSQL